MQRYNTLLNSKFQAPNSKQIPSTKHQIPNKSQKSKIKMKNKMKNKK